ncbi:MAG: phosphoribosylamine--glycine ligase [Acidobacteriota bacterium]
MKVLVIGSGGREHALVWALKQSKLVRDIYTTSTNAGILSLARSAEVGPDIDSVSDFAIRERIDLTVIGPEQPLVDGLADCLSSLGLTVFGPRRMAARLEGSKVFAKEFMQRNGVPTGRFEIANNANEGFALIERGAFRFPVVLKADGLAAGKGVIIAQDEAEARQGVEDLMVRQAVGEAGSRVLFEECLVGRELSYLVLCDGSTYSALPVAQDHKRAFDGDRGPNTGGMGAFSVDGLLDSALEDRIQREIVEPTLEGARREGFPFQGVLYCGLMLTSDGPMALEYNVRFGDPETQAILRRLNCDLAELCVAVGRGELARYTPRWNDRAAACVVVASAGYPGKYGIGATISGIEEAEDVDSVVVFHAGTRMDGGRTLTAGGRVLGVTAVAPSLAEATSRAYQGVARISFEGMHFRSDIGI